MIVMGALVVAFIVGFGDWVWFHRTRGLDEREAISVHVDDLRSMFTSLSKQPEQLLTLEVWSQTCSPPIGDISNSNLNLPWCKLGDYFVRVSNLSLGSIRPMAAIAAFRTASGRQLVVLMANGAVEVIPVETMREAEQAGIVFFDGLDAVIR